MTIKQMLVPPGITIYELNNYVDCRGTFLKNLSDNIVNCLSPGFVQRESFVTISKKNVLRGMHYQKPSNQKIYKKLVTCVAGSVVDVIVDINKESPFYNKPFSTILDSKSPKILAMPVFYAHGFLALEDNTIMHYSTDLVYDSSGDKGVHWESINFKWPCCSPTVSVRDSHHPFI